MPEVRGPLAGHGGELTLSDGRLAEPEAAADGHSVLRAFSIPPSGLILGRSHLEFAWRDPAQGKRDAVDGEIREQPKPVPPKPRGPRWCAYTAYVKFSAV